MNSWLRALLVVVLVTAAAPATGHGIHHQQARAEAVVVTLTYADGNPFAFERYRIREAGTEAPLQTGRTDARGRIVFLPDGEGPWSVRAESEDGHGHRLTVEAASTGKEAPAPEPAARRPAYGVLGIGILLALFGGWALHRSRRSSTP